MTVGTQLPFDRLIRAVDAWKGEASGEAASRVFAQIGASDYRPAAIDWTHRLTPAECRSRFQEASLIVGHAGMGTIISALELGKPVVIMPRRKHFGEHRTDHQLWSVDVFREHPGVFVAEEESGVQQAIVAAQAAEPSPPIQKTASSELLAEVSRVIGDAPKVQRLRWRILGRLGVRGR